MASVVKRRPTIPLSNVAHVPNWEHPSLRYIILQNQLPYNIIIIVHTDSERSCLYTPK